MRTIPQRQGLRGCVSTEDILWEVELVATRLCVKFQEHDLSRSGQNDVRTLVIIVAATRHHPGIATASSEVKKVVSGHSPNKPQTLQFVHGKIVWGPPVIWMSEQESPVQEGLEVDKRLAVELEMFKMSVALEPQ